MTAVGLTIQGVRGIRVFAVDHLETEGGCKFATRVFRVIDLHGNEVDITLFADTEEQLAIEQVAALPTDPPATAAGKDGAS